MAAPEEIERHHEGLEAAIEHGIKAGIRMERARIAAIVRSPDAHGSLELAVWLALDEAALPVRCATGILSSIPKTVVTDANANVTDIRQRRAALRLIENERIRSHGEEK